MSNTTNSDVCTAHDELVAALAPFAEMVDHYDQHDDDILYKQAGTFITVGDLRRARLALAAARPRKFTPNNCPHCEYDRRFPGFETGGWLQQENNGPIVSCPLCNEDGSHV